MPCFSVSPVVLATIPERRHFVFCSLHRRALASAGNASMRWSGLRQGKPYQCFPAYGFLSGLDFPDNDHISGRKGSPSGAGI